MQLWADQEFSEKRVQGYGTSNFLKFSQDLFTLKQGAFQSLEIIWKAYPWNTVQNKF
jgi:hypothetical protein